MSLVHADDLEKTHISGLCPHALLSPNMYGSIELKGLIFIMRVRGNKIIQANYIIMIDIHILKLFKIRIIQYFKYDLYFSLLQ